MPRQRGGLARHRRNRRRSCGRSRHGEQRGPWAIGLGNRPFDAVLLRGAWVAREDKEEVRRAVNWAGWSDRGPKWRAFSEGGAVLRVTHAKANNWLSRALRTALTHWRYQPQRPTPPQPSPNASGAAGDGHARRQWSGVQEAGPRTPGDRAGGLGADQRHEAALQQARAPPP